MLLLLFFIFAPPGMPAEAATAGAEIQNEIYMPVILKVEPFTVTESTTLPGGHYTYQSLVVPAGVTLTVSGDVTIRVWEKMQIAGSLVADCHQVALHGEGPVEASGKIDNRCSGDPAAAGDLIVHTTHPSLTLGTAAAPLILETSGNLDLANDPALQEWEFDVLPDQRSAAKLPPVCSARADTLLDTVTAGFPIGVAFEGDGADPDGGPVTYAWDFGDLTGSTDRDPLHEYAGWGVYHVQLTVTDDEGQTCEAALSLTLDDGEANLPENPAVWGAPFDLVVPAGEPALFSLEAEDPQGMDLAYLWDFGDGATAPVSDTEHIYAAPGRYPVTLVVTDTAGFASEATGAIYVYQPPAAAMAQLAPDTCAAFGPGTFNVRYNVGDAPAAAGRSGRSATFRGRGNIYLWGTTVMNAQDGGDGANKNGSGTVIADRGGRGGSLQFLVAGRLTICGGASLSAGDGGDGGNATSNTPAPGTAYARAGNGGNAASLLRLAATQGLSFEAPGMVSINPGSGGDGGLSSAIGGDGAAQCPVGQAGATAISRGGNGGRASKFARVRGNVGGLGNVNLTGGQGGTGGTGDALGGSGGDAVCQSNATGGSGKPARAFGGRGGKADLSGAIGQFIIAANAFTGGTGGAATADAGWGGDATATADPCQAATATGGAAAKATAYGGDGGAGYRDGNGGDGTADGGWGGLADASGGDCDQCGGAGGAATATGGPAGDAYARYGRRGGGSAADGTATATGGDGGPSFATGGAGGDCTGCDEDGGDGGPANATGGLGGDAAGNGTRNGGDGGDADALGGRGGNGGDCPCVKFLLTPGGDGGAGGSATSVAGNPGSPGGQVGANATSGGNGGDGGDGDPPGVGGPGGTGTGIPADIPDGAPGLGGALDRCPIVIWYIYHSMIPDGPIVPGTSLPLPVYPTSTLPAEEVGSVPTVFLPGTGADYFKAESQVFVVDGTISYDLGQIDPATFPVVSVEFRLNDTCGVAGCIQLQGYFQGETVGPPVFNQDGLGEETLVLPPPPEGVPVYDGFQISGVSFDFDHWWVIIIDP